MTCLESTETTIDEASLAEGLSTADMSDSTVETTVKSLLDEIRAKIKKNQFKETTELLKDLLATNKKCIGTHF